IRYSANHHDYDETYAYYNDLRHDEEEMYFRVLARTNCKFKIQLFKECENHHQYPTVEFEKPHTHQEICKGEDLYVKVKAHSQHSIKHVKLYVNGELVRTENSAPYEWGRPHAQDDHWLNHMQPGHYELKAVAEDHHGYKTTKTFTITVKHCNNGGGHHGPDVHFDNLHDGKRFHRHQDLYVKVNAHDHDGVEYVKLYVNGHFVRTENNAPYEWGRPHAQNDHRLNHMQHGTYHIKAVAKDRHGNTTTKTVTIYVD
ncbi:MAG: Ig-like domain-containing protein, partial [Bacteroidota bacterium]